MFVTGIDTDAGKSYATGWLARQMAADGHNVITQKFIQTGNTDFSEDIAVHRRLMEIEPVAADRLGITAPVIFTYPASPLLASRIDDKPLRLEIIDEATRVLLSSYDNVIVEGAGGLMVPLFEEYFTLDYIRDRELPAVLVTNGRLGSVSHTLLSLEAMRAAGIKLFAVVYNPYFDSDPVISKDTREYLRRQTARLFPNALYLEMD
ncbi:MAG: ATP-dependent dethiobiotin synthetase BioD [Bacteroidales bacterium]|nr:ATP-dependent dethiobiotin synthetase BioD [Bacteroidales bacterium]